MTGHDYYYIWAKKVPAPILPSFPVDMDHSAQESPRMNTIQE